MILRTERLGMDFSADVPRQLRNQMVGNQIAKLLQKQTSQSRLVLPCGKAHTGKPTLLITQPQTKTISE